MARLKLFLACFAALLIAIAATPTAKAESPTEFYQVVGYDHVDRTPGPLGVYIMPAVVSKRFVVYNEENFAEQTVVYHFIDADGELWIIDEVYLATMCEVPLEAGQQVQIVMCPNGTVDDFTDDYFLDVFVCEDPVDD